MTVGKKPGSTDPKDAFAGWLRQLVVSRRRVGRRAVPARSMPKASRRPPTSSSRYATVETGPRHRPAGLPHDNRCHPQADPAQAEPMVEGEPFMSASSIEG
jgi:hypothetical protein